MKHRRVMILGHAHDEIDQMIIVGQGEGESIKRMVMCRPEVLPELERPAKKLMRHHRRHSHPKARLPATPSASSSRRYIN
jgi:hypothetical protein